MTDQPRTEPDAGPIDQLVGMVFFAAWRLAGLLAWPFALLHPGARRHVWKLVTGEPGMTWLHGASAGEHQAARPLAKALPEGALRTSSSWRTPVAGAFPAPLDLPWLTGRWLDAGRPGRLVLIEAELWPGWLVACRRRGIPVAVVHARDSRGTARWRRVGPLWRWLVQGVTFVSQAHTGDLKIQSPPTATATLPRPAFIAASTRPGDESRLLEAWAHWPNPPLLLLAPRHLERLDEIGTLLDESPLRWSLRSNGLDDIARADVVLLDSMGELSSLFAQGRAAFVGGTFDQALGGHSPAEALSTGLPVVHGPHTHANPAAWSTGVHFAVGADASPAQLAQVLRLAWQRGPGEPARSDAVDRTVAALPAGRPPPETWARPWLWPLVPVVQGLGRLRSGWRGRPVKIEVPVVSVGSLSAGGSGKTPVVAWLASRLPGAWVVARGYRREAAGPAVRVGLPDQPPEHDLGDELEMLRRRGLPVVSAPDRVAGAREAAARGARVIVLDDGFQHRRLDRDLDILVVDARWPDSRGPIPVGWRREPRSGAARAHLTWVHHATERQGDVRSTQVPTGWRQGGHHRPLPARRGPVDAVAGIAHPAGFLATLLRLGLEVRSFRALPDHGALGALPEDAVITEKDAARLPEDHVAWALCIGLDVQGAELLFVHLDTLGIAHS